MMVAQSYSKNLGAPNQHSRWEVLASSPLYPLLDSKAIHYMSACGEAPAVSSVL